MIFHPKLHLTVALFSLTALVACGENSGGVRGYTAFKATADVTDIAATGTVAAFASCFRERATFLPFSRFDQTPGRFTYTLTAKDLWLEELVITQTGAGVVGEFRASGIYDDGWRAILERDRLPALTACQS